MAAETAILPSPNALSRSRAIDSAITRIAAAQREGRVLRTILTESKSGRQAWRAPVFIDTTGGPCERNERGEKVSPFGFTTHRGTDVWGVLASALSRCDATVRARGYRAAVVKIEGTEWKRGTAESRVRHLDACIAQATGIDAADVTDWAVDEADALAAA